MLACLDRPQRERGVEVMGEADVDYRDGIVTEELVERRRNPLAAARPLYEIGVEVTNRNQFGVA